MEACACSWMLLAFTIPMLSIDLTMLSTMLSTVVAMALSWWCR